MMIMTEVKAANHQSLRKTTKQQTAKPTKSVVSFRSSISKQYKKEKSKHHQTRKKEFLCCGAHCALNIYNDIEPHMRENERANANSCEELKARISYPSYQSIKPFHNEVSTAQPDSIKIAIDCSLYSFTMKMNEKEKAIIQKARSLEIRIVLSFCI